MKVAMMQPYFFPYLGYFQLVNAVDVFIFADDMNFIKGGFINRNKILFKNEERYVTVPCFQSQNKLINEIQISIETKGYPETLLLTIKHAYAKAPFFLDVFPLIESIFYPKEYNIARLAANSVEKVSKYLGINTDFKYSSSSFKHTKGQDKSDRLINITKELGGNTYRNPIGGSLLYNKDYFKKQGINLEFLVIDKIVYPQFGDNFVPNLSIIDVLMFNSIENINKLLNQYKIV
jgi:hypothetical protein